MREEQRKLYHTDFNTVFYFLAVTALVIYTLSTLSSLFTPIAVSILIWFLINALASKLKRFPILKTKIGQYSVIPLSVIIILSITIQTGSFIGASMVELSSAVSGLDVKISSAIEKLSQTTGFDLAPEVNKILEQFSISGVINKVFGLFSEIMGNIVQILLYVLFLLLDQRFFNVKMNALFSDKNDRLKAKEVIHKISESIREYISITTAVSFGTGLLTYIICAAFGLEGAALWGFIAFLLNFIPTIGSFIAVLLPTLFAFVQLSELFDVLLLIPSLVFIQFLFGNVIQPKMMGNRLNISQFVVILSLVIWGMMWGTVGMFLAVPMMVMIMIVLAQFENTKFISILISGNGKIT